MSNYVSKFKIQGQDVLVKDSEARTELASKASASSVNALSSRVGTVETVKADKSEVLAVASAVNGKASQASVDNLQAQMNTFSGDISDINNSISGLSGSTSNNAINISALEARVDAITQLPEGSTSGDAELMDIRTGAFGETYSSAGVAVRKQVEYLWKNAVMNGLSDMLMPYLIDFGTAQRGLTFTRNGDEYQISGTAQSTGGINFVLSENSVPFGVKEADKLRLTFDMTNAPTTGVVAEVWQYPNSGDPVYVTGINTLGATPDFHGRLQFDFPASAKGMLVRFYVQQGTVFNGTIAKVSVHAVTSYDVLKSIEYNQDYLNLNEVPDNVFTVCVDSYSYSNAPIAPPFLLLTTRNYTVKYQIVLAWNTGTMYFRHWLSGTWSDWMLISGGGGSGSEINYNVYQNTYNVTATPTIVQDNTQFLASTNDTTDRTNDIVTMLATSGVCRLGTGVFYVDGIVMPDYSSIIGSGKSTRIIVKSGDNKFGVQLGSNCTLKDVMIEGSVSPIDISSTIRGRKGIVWIGTYGDDEQGEYRSVIENVTVRHFAGSGLMLNNTGYSPEASLMVTDCMFYDCDCGVNIAYWSEYSKFSNIQCVSCYYGMINNGGNNLIANSVFSNNIVDYLMDNEQSQSPNNSHGSMSGCSFNHANSNTGYGIIIKNCDNGFMFTGCQIFFGKTSLQNSDGVAFIGCNFGQSNCDIEINGGGAILYQGCFFQGQPTKSIVNNEHVVFDNCYVRSTGAAVTAS